jgi:hypothetical protein
MPPFGIIMGKTPVAEVKRLKYAISPSIQEDGRPMA